MLEISPPGCQAPTVVANVYMPTGHGVPSVEWSSIAALLVKGCRGAHERGLNVVLHGDFNADSVKGQHQYSPMSASAARRGEKLRSFMRAAELSDVPHLNEKGRRAATWRSGCGSYSGVIDYGLVSRTVEVGGCRGALMPHAEDHVLDHAMLITSVPSSVVGKALLRRGRTDTEETMERVQWRVLKSKADAYREATRSIDVDEIGPNGENLSAAQRLAQWGVQAREVAKRLCGVIRPRRPREVPVPPGHRMLRRLQTYLGKWLRRERKLLRRAEVSRVDTQPGQGSAAEAWRRKWGRRVERSSLEDLPLSTRAGGGVTVDEVKAKVESLTKDCETVRARLWKDEREGRKVSLQEYKQFIRKAFGAGGIKNIMGKRTRQQEPWGISTEGPVGVEFSSARAANQAIASGGLPEVVWHLQRNPPLALCQRPQDVHLLVSALQHMSSELSIVKRGPSGHSIHRPVYTDDSSKRACKNAHLQKEGVSTRRRCVSCRGSDVWPILCGPEGLSRMLCATCAQVTRTVLEPTPHSPLLDAVPRLPENHARSLRGPITRQELDALLSRLAGGKSPGGDDVAGEAYMMAEPDAFRPILLDAVNEMLNGTTPVEAKGGVVRFLKKKDPDSEISNLRPIVLLNVSYKIGTMVIFERLRAIVEDFNLIGDPQEGSQREHSCQRQLQRLEWARQRAESKGLQWIVVQLDFTSAFNSIDHQALFMMLRAFNLPDLDLLEGLYNESWYCVNCDRLGERVSMERGTKQGDVLSPLVFALAMEVLLRNWEIQEAPIEGAVQRNIVPDTHKRSLLCAFVDDLSPCSTSVPRSSRLLGVAEEFAEWAGMFFNVNKCSVSAINFKTGEQIQTSSLCIRGTPVPVVNVCDSSKYLGMMTNIKGDWSDERDRVLIKMRTDLQAIRTAGPLATWQKVALVEMCVRAHARYSFPVAVWPPADLEKVDKILCQGYKMAHGLPARGVDASVMMLAKRYGGWGVTPARVTYSDSIISHVLRIGKGSDMLAEDEMAQRVAVRDRYGGASWEAIGSVFDTSSIHTHVRMAASLASHGTLLLEPGGEAPALDPMNIIEVLASSDAFGYASFRKKQLVRRGVESLCRGGQSNIRHLVAKRGKWTRADMLGTRDARVTEAQLCAIMECVEAHSSLCWRDLDPMGMAPHSIRVEALPDALRVTLDEKEHLLLQKIDETDAQMVESVVGFSNGAYLIRWRSVNWPEMLSTQEMKKWLCENRASVWVPRSISSDWAEFRGGPWTLECLPNARKGGPGKVLTEVVSIGSHIDPDEEGVLGMESLIHVSTDLASIKWCRENHGASQPVRSRHDRWVSADAMHRGGGLIMACGRTINETLTDMWGAMPYVAGEPWGTNDERLRYPSSGPGDREKDPAPNPRSKDAIVRGNRPLAVERDREPWEMVCLKGELVHVDLEAVNLTTRTEGEYEFRARSGLTSIWKLGGGGPATKICVVETPVLEGVRAESSDERVCIDEIVVAADAMSIAEAAGVRIPHWDFTTAVALIIQSDTLVGLSPLVRDPYFPRFLQLHQVTGEEAEAGSAPAGADRWPAGSIVILPENCEEVVRDEFDRQMESQARVVVFSSPETASACRLEENGLERITTLPLEQRPTMVKGSFSSGKKDRVKGRSPWQVWTNFTLGGDQERRIQELASAGPPCIDRWATISSNPGSVYGNAYLRAQSGGKYHDFPGIRISTDGSLCVTAGENAMGFGAISILEDGTKVERCGPVYLKEGQVESSLIPEAEAITSALQGTPRDVPVALCTDSLNVLYAIKNMLNTVGRDLRNVRRNVECLGPVIVEIGLRTAETYLVKVDAHKGHQGNEEADRLAEKGRCGEFQEPPQKRGMLVGVRNGEEVNASFLRQWKSVIRTADEEVTKTVLEKKHVKRATRATTFLLREKQGIPIVGQAMRSVPSSVASFQMRSVAGAVMTQSRLKTCKMSQSDLCALPGCAGSNQRETLEHVQCFCPALKLAQMAAHNAIADTSSRAILEALSLSQEGWTREIEKTMGGVWGGRTPRGSELSANLAALKPDAVLIHESRRVAHILEYSRPWDKDLTALRDSATRKREKYADLISALRLLMPEWNIALTTVIVGVRGTVDETDLRESLAQMQLEHPEIDQVLLKTIREAITQGYGVWMARNACRAGGVHVGDTG